MQRKVIKQGNGSYTITLPKKWVDAHGFSETIEVTEESKGLLIHTHTVALGKDIELSSSFTDLSRLRTTLSALYRRGYTKVTLEKPALTYEELLSSINSLQSATLQDFSSTQAIILFPSEKDPKLVESTIRRMFFLTQMIMGSSDKNSSLLNQESLKLRDYSQRLINLNSYGGDKSYEYNSIIFILEKLCSLFNQRDVTISDTYFEELFKAYSKKDFAQAQQLNKDLSSLRKEKIDTKDAVVTEWLFTLSSRIVSICI